MVESAIAQDQLTCNGFSAWIVVDGAKSKVYGVNYDAEDKACCWIESEIDKEFSVAFVQNEGGTCKYTAMVGLDGHSVAHVAYQKHRWEQNVISTVRISATEYRKFVFASLEMTDDDSYLEAYSSQNVGEISLLIRRVKSRMVKPTPMTFSLPTSGKVHERLKKGLAHQVKYVAPKDTAASDQPRINHRYTCSYHEGLTTFTFKYRPLAMLQAMGIVPCTPSATASESYSFFPLPSPSDGPKKHKKSIVKAEHSDNDNLPDEEENSDDDSEQEKEVLAELERIKKERELLAQLKKIRNRKRIKKQLQDPPPKKVKREPGPHYIQGEVIDLT